MDLLVVFEDVVGEMKEIRKTVQKEEQKAFRERIVQGEQCQGTPCEELRRRRAGQEPTTCRSSSVFARVRSSSVTCGPHVSFCHRVVQLAFAYLCVVFVGTLSWFLAPRRPTQDSQLGQFHQNPRKTMRHLLKPFSGVAESANVDEP